MVETFTILGSIHSSAMQNLVGMLPHVLHEPKMVAMILVPWLDAQHLESWRLNCAVVSWQAVSLSHGRKSESCLLGSMQNIHG